MRDHLCWLCFLQRIKTVLSESRCPMHGLVKDRILGIVRVDTRFLQEASVADG